MPAGSILFVSPVAVHRGGENFTDSETRVIAIEYRSAGNPRVDELDEDLAYCDLSIVRPNWRLILQL